MTVDPEIPLPPTLYGGIERIVTMLIEEYLKANHSITLIAHPDSKVDCELIGWKGLKSQNMFASLKNIIIVADAVFANKYDVIHSFSRLAYMIPIMPFWVPKLMSYQREPSLQQIAKAKKLARKGSLVFTGCSNYITNQIKTVAEGYTIYNCAPVEKYTFTETVEADAPLVFLGRIEHIKGTHIAIEVAQRTNRRLIIAGNIPEAKKDYFDKKIKPYLSDRIVYIGPVNDDQKNAILGEALAFLMPIQWNEPFGIVMAEAMACGTPVLGFPYGSVPEVVTNGLNGFVCCDASEMAERIGMVTSIERKKVREIAEERFSNKKIASDYLALYSKMIKTRS